MLREVSLFLAWGLTSSRVGAKIFNSLRRGCEKFSTRPEGEAKIFQRVAKGRRAEFQHDLLFQLTKIQCFLSSVFIGFGVFLKFKSLTHSLGRPKTTNNMSTPYLPFSHEGSQF